MPFDNVSLTERVQSSFKQLTVAANSLNNRSDQLGKAVARLDTSVQKLSLGISAWVPFSTWSGEDGSYGSDEIGYAKVNGKWGIAIRSTQSHESACDYTAYEEWLFNDAPRALRVKAVGGIPDLFDRLTKEAVSTADQVHQQLKVVDEFTGAIDAIAPDQSDAAGRAATRK